MINFISLEQLTLSFNLLFFLLFQVVASEADLRLRLLLPASLGLFSFSFQCLLLTPAQMRLF
jgi:hypothetical protein